MSDISSKYAVMRSSNMVVKIKNTKNTVANSNGTLKTTGPGPFKQSVGDIALQKIKKYEEKYLKKSSTDDEVPGVTSVSEESDVESGPEASTQGDVSGSPKFDAGFVGNVKFANFSDSESASEIVCDLGSGNALNEVAPSTKDFAEPKLVDEGLEDDSGEVRNSPPVMTEVEEESSSVSTYLQCKILPIENLKFGGSDEDKYENVGIVSNSSESSSTCETAKVSRTQNGASYSESFDDVVEKSVTEVNTESKSVNLSRVGRQSKDRYRSQDGKKTMNLSQAGCKLENKATQTVFKKVTKALPRRSFVNPLPSTSAPKGGEPFLFSNFNTSENVEEMANFDVSREVLKQQVALTKHYIGCQRAMYRAYCRSVETLSAHYKPVTLKDTEELIRKHGRSSRKNVDTRNGNVM